MLLDTYAWIEFFRGTDSGKNVREILRTEICCTSIISIAEVVEWCLKNNLNARIGEYVKGVTRGSVVLDLDEQIAMAAGKINYERKKKIKGWGMVDSFILATGASYNLNILTGDSHFKDLPSAKML
jgi:predicted nucleic acid-binding protein